MEDQDSSDLEENCDPHRPQVIKYENIAAAANMISGTVVYTHTPCIKARLSEIYGLDLYLKQEFLQYTGCFKERGVYNALMLLSEDEKRLGVISATTGNHGIALSYHSSLLKIPCTVVMPAVASMSKFLKCESFGAKVIRHGDHLSEAKAYAMRMSDNMRMVYINGYDHPNIIEGHGSIGIEIIDQLPDVDAVLVPVGGGSLLCGVAIAVKHRKPNILVYGIETEKTNCMAESLKKQNRVTIKMDTTISDGLAVNKVGVNTFHNVKDKQLVDGMVVVKEDDVARAVLHLVEEEKIVIEGGAAVGVAAILAGMLPNLKSKTVVCILTGGNIASTTLTRVIERGLKVEGRLVKFTVTMTDQTQDVIKVIRTKLSHIGVQVRDCMVEKSWIKHDVFHVEVKIIAETRGWHHTNELVELVKKRFLKHSFKKNCAKECWEPLMRQAETLDLLLS